MRLCYLAILIVTLTTSACALDTGIAPSERAAAAAAQGDANGEGGEGTDGQGTDAASAGPSSVLPGSLTQTQGLWPSTYSTTLRGGGWTLEPLGAQRGVSGTVSAPDGSLHLEALP